MIRLELKIGRSIDRFSVVIRAQLLHVRGEMAV